MLVFIVVREIENLHQVRDEAQQSNSASGCRRFGLHDFVFGVPNSAVLRRSRAGRSLNLEHVDVALIDRAEHEIDMAAYVLTDWAVMQALTRAADRGVQIRIYLDGTQFAEREPAKVFHDLAETPR